MRSELQLLTVMAAGICVFITVALLYQPLGMWLTFGEMRFFHICSDRVASIPRDLWCPR